MKTVTVTADGARPRGFGGRITKLMHDAFRAGAVKDESELERLKEEARDAIVEATPQSVETDPSATAAGAEGEHLHVHLHTGDKPETDEADPSAAVAAAGTAGPDTAAGIAEVSAKLDQVMGVLGELADAEAEEDDLSAEEANGEEVADRRRRVHDRKRRVRDSMRGWRKTRDAGEAGAPGVDPDAVGVAPPGTGPGKNSITSTATVGDRRGATDAATVDSRGLEDEFNTLLARAEILVPGMKPMVFDAAVKRGQTQDRMCAFRRRALDAAYRTETGQGAIDDVLAGQVFDVRNASCAQVATVFNGAAAVVAAANRQRGAGSGMVARDAATGDANPIAAINKRNRERAWQR